MQWRHPSTPVTTGTPLLGAARNGAIFGGIWRRQWCHPKARLKPATVHQELRVLRRMMNVAVRKKLLPANPCAGVEFPVKVKGLFRPHYVGWSEQQRIEFQAPEYLLNIIRIITESRLRVYKELMPMKREQVALENAVVWIRDSKTPNGIADAPFTDLAVDAFREQIRIAGPGPWLFPSDENPTGHQKMLKTVWHATLRRAKYRISGSTICGRRTRLASARVAWGTSG
jgi:integrase